MNPRTICVSLAIIAQSFAAAQAPSQAAHDYDMGMAIGLCMSAKCQVFHGFLSTNAPQSGESVSVRVDQWWSGPHSATETISVPYEESPARCSGDGGCPVASAWMNVKASPNGPLVVVLGLEKGFGTLPGIPVFVTSDEREAEIIRLVTKEAARLDGSPELISEAVASLSRVPNPALAGYMYARLKFSKMSVEGDRWADLFWQLIENPSVPPDRWGEIAVWLVSCYDTLSSAGRTLLVSRLRDLGQQEDALPATIGVAGLAEIASHDASVEIGIPPATLVRLRSSYAALVSKGSIYSNLGPLKALLGVR
jgi:hypothetical protein